MKAKSIKRGAVLFFAATSLAVVHAADFLGANGVLQQVAERHAKPGEKTGVDENKKFLGDLEEFNRTVTNLAPADAAKRWLELVDRMAKLPAPDGRSYRPANGSSLLGALPPPATWSELAKAVAARPPAKGVNEIREAGLRFLTATLTDDPAAMSREISFLATKTKDANSQQVYYYRSFLDQISQAMLARSDNPDTILQSLERQLNAAQSRGREELPFPNLVAQVGPSKAEAFLRRALVTPNVTLTFNQPNETARLAQKLALELVGQLKSPQWGIVNSLDAVELYEALEKKFPAPTNTLTAIAGLTNLPPDTATDLDQNDNQKSGAKMYYLLGLIGKDRAKDAVAVAKKMGGERNLGYQFDEAFKVMRQAGFAEAMDNFFYELLTQDPTLPFWEQYVRVAADAGKTERMLATVRQVAARADLSDRTQSELHLILFKALLAADNADEAVKELRKLAAMNEAADDTAGYNLGQYGVLLAQTGRLLERPEWTEEGIGLAKKWLTTAAGKKRVNDNTDQIVTTLVKILSDLNRGPEAEALLTDALATATAEEKSERSYSWRGSRAAQTLTQLALLYHRAGRHADVLHLLENAADWGTTDVGGLFESGSEENTVALMWLHTGTSPQPVPYLAAKALLVAGQKETAQKITDELLNHFPGLDRGYELLLELQGTNAIGRLDELFARDQFEERPLIWKAHLFREQNQLEAAEKILRQAISIDPSDGEEGRGDRMRVYAELAEVRAARGDQKEADFFGEVVKAIRLSETADQFYAAGLLKRAVGMYQDGLKHFSDAYCIQSRLAIQLSALGLAEEAEQHYRRAFELMPDSFGRVESHCFGCERAFDGERAQSIAEKTFSKLAEERPDKPQIHYLLGYLRLEQERFSEARTNFFTAVHLDPDYLNAWVKLQESTEQILIPAKERDAITFNILRLDPLGRHTGANFSRVSDLAGLWHAVAAAAAQQPIVNTNLFALAASKLALAGKMKSAEKGDAFGRDYFPDYYSSRSAQRTSPAQAVSETPFVRIAGEMLSSGGNLTDW